MPKQAKNNIPKSREMEIILVMDGYPCPFWLTSKNISNRKPYKSISNFKRGQEPYKDHYFHYISCLIKNHNGVILILYPLHERLHETSGLAFIMLETQTQRRLATSNKS